MEIDKIVDMAKNGDKKAVEEIINRFKPLIIKYSKRTFISGYDENDFKQIGYLTILKAIKKYDSRISKNFEAYVCLALRNNYYYEIRQRCRNNFEISLNKPIAEGVELGDELLSVENIEENFMHSDNINKVLNIVKYLPPDEKEFIEYIYFKDRSLKAYSYTKNIGYNTCAKRKERIIKKIRRNFIETETLN